MNDCLVFEKVGDINTEYPYLNVYIYGCSDPFMEISISHEKNILFTLFLATDNIVLSSEQWIEIKCKSDLFLKKTLADEEFGTY
ncbi:MULTISPECIES: hypothetical protein [Rahnella]|uniref:4'-phosphopantetheinyl transferase domain-containing protein n=1 Tax=Rahnella laticis TaxID=2787622 RepID=A0ABS0E134_9GAMM|nr:MULTISPECIES: hypothetical protein [Rahnella]MBF7978762.1 hypothetical protein [Rahnella laticis]MBF7998852.1 hypothetical protein [Rahnella sp. LAC-M12]